jgi:RNA 3'-terminal phosphate cyclase (ATP)
MTSGIERGARVLIDGSCGEGGGQIVRTALSLAACTGRPVRIDRVRARRRRPGLQPQHLAAVRAMQAICAASVEGAELGSGTVSFEPGPVRAGRYRFDVGTAGSTVLVLQTVLPALAAADGPSEIEIIGGTHNPLAPTFEFLNESFLPLVARIGVDVRLELVRYGFYPRGGGCLRAHVGGSSRWQPLVLRDRGAILHRSIEILLARLPGHIAERELGVLCARLGMERADTVVRPIDASSPGNVAVVRVESEALCLVLSELGVRGRRAEDVAEALAERVIRYLHIAAPIDEYLADQILVPLALAGGGAFVTVAPSAHALTNAAVIEAFLPVEVKSRPVEGERHEIQVQPAVVPGVDPGGPDSSGGARTM